MWGPRAVIDSAALRHNLAVARARAPRAKVMAVVKANAYGHGIVPSARALIGADAFGVARLSEALALREHGLGQSIVLLEGAFSHEEMDVASAHGLEIVVHSPEQLQILSTWRSQRQVHAWLKVDTGMNRLGFRREEFGDALRSLRACASIAPNYRIMTHLSCADEPDKNTTANQLNEFRRLTGALAAERSVANSAGLLAWPSTHCDWVRPGLMLYGISPFADKSAAELDLRPAMTLVTRLIAIRSVKAGESVGYGATWHAPTACRVGIAAIGYGDGYARQIGTGSPVLVDGTQCSVVGRVSMDMIAVDLTPTVDARVGSDVTLWGKGLPVEQMAICAQTIPYELVCGISQRVAVEYA